jgi:hypothetical protein
MEYFSGSKFLITGETPLTPAVVQKGGDAPTYRLRAEKLSSGKTDKGGKG